jgi:hypothetical protein
MKRKPVNILTPIPAKDGRASTYIAGLQPVSLLGPGMSSLAGLIRIVGDGGLVNKVSHFLCPFGLIVKTIY